ncbi:MAG: PolC-type DNA polymerase III [Clostridia bacterium]|nr:PolC-type DNA polymerase III [Clostridia bacterium]
MNENFTSLFSEYSCTSEGLRQAKVVKILMDRDRRGIELWLKLDRYLDKEELNRICLEVQKLYGLDRLQLHCRYEGIELTADYAPMLAQYLGQVCPGCRGFLDDAAMTVEEDRVTLALTHGGGEALARAEGRRILSELLLEEFGKHYAVEFTGVLELQELTEGLSIAPPIKAEPKAEPRRIAVKQGIARRSAGELLCGKRFDGAPVPMRSVDLDSGSVTVEGEVFGLESRASKNGKTVIVSFNLTDLTSSLPVKMFLQIEKAEQLLSKLKDGSYIRLRGEMQLDRYTNELAVMARDILQVEKKVRKDNAPKKRVELHLHTTMSQMDAVTPVEAYLKRAAEWGHPALAITDHGVLQAYPDACNGAKKAGFEGKILYGIEAYFISENNSDSSPRQDSFADPFVIFDLETTGLSPRTDRMTEIGAVLVREGEVLDRFHTFVNPERPIPYEITKLTGITDEMVRNAPSEQEALSEFLSFVKGYTLVAHNASFDVSFLRAAAGRCGMAVDNPSVDTLAIARCALPQLKNHRLDTLAAHFQVSLRHHRADNDAEALSQIFFGLTELGKAQGASTVQELFEVFGNRRDLRLARTYHLIILAKNMVGLKNLFRLVSKSNLEYFGNKRPKIPKSELLRHREGLILGSACEAGELFTAIVNGAPREELLRIASFYDYLEIQPISNNRFLVANGTAKDDDHLRAYNKTVVSLGEELDIPVCATGDVHFLEPEDEIFRSILLASQGYEDADRQNPLYFRTTEEMLEEFSYLGEEKAFEVVVTNTNLVADWCDTVVPLKKGMFPPEIPGADQELREITAKKAKELYGDPLPERVRERLERELDPIIGNGYAVMYIIARRLVQESRRNGYLVGSRGSVGSSLAAYFAQITEVNALPPHYVCPACHFIRFDDSGAYEAGCDMPDLICPNCGSKCRKDGFNIPFETFMGFSGEKVPDIDLNFSGEYQTQAHKYAESLFPRRHVFRAGTIATVAEKTAFGYVKKYLAERGRVVPRAEEERLVRGCTGIKRTTGQHPGGIMVVPEAFDIEDFTPVQHPADDPDKNVVTTHFDYHAIHDNILKLDMLGHDDPTALRMLGDLTGIDVTTLPLNDPEVLALFSGVESLKLMPGENVGNNGSIAIPEFGTGFVRGMLEQTKPTTVGELVRISGLSHGTDVWLGNAETLIRNNTCSLREAICCRDDIMTYLIQKGLPKSDSFKIMEQVRKGKGVSEEQAGLMREHSVPDWYIDSCRAIKYLFPRAHAVAYVTMALRIAWFKVHHPLPFYATYFSVRADAFDASVMTKGKAALEQLQRDVANLDKKSMKDEDRATVAEVCLEMLARGYTFLPVDLYRSDATTFLIEGNALRPPLASLPGVGENAAAAIAQAREGRAFTSQEELIAQARVSRAVVETLAQNGALGDLPVSAQLSLF